MLILLKSVQNVLLILIVIVSPHAFVKTCISKIPQKNAKNAITDVPSVLKKTNAQNAQLAYLDITMYYKIAYVKLDIMILIKLIA